MGGRRRWLRRTLGKAKGEVVELPQRDGTNATFSARVFWHRLFLDQIDAACGVVPDSPVAEAMEGATSQARGRIERIAASGRAGDFMRGSGGDEEKRLLEVADPVEDLSEQA
jgi:hypothetical protein